MLEYTRRTSSRSASIRRSPHLAVLMGEGKLVGDCITRQLHLPRRTLARPTFPSADRASSSRAPSLSGARTIVALIHQAAADDARTHARSRRGIASDCPPSRGRPSMQPAAGGHPMGGYQGTVERSRPRTPLNAVELCCPR